jgi:hypothetical protein
MPISRSRFEQDLSRAVTDDELEAAGGWPVEPYYEVRHEPKSLYVVAALLVGDDEEDQSSDRRWYRPLADTPTLFLDFAQLADRHIDEDVWLSWIHKYGVLGLGVRREGKWVVSGSAGGPLETLSQFRRSARVARVALRLYEDATNSYGTDPKTIASLIHDEPIVLMGALRANLETSEAARNTALFLTEDLVANVLRSHAYPELRSTPEGFVSAWGFHSLLGAMFLQMMWLITGATSGVKRCAGPGCPRVIDLAAPRLESEGRMLSAEKDSRGMEYAPRRKQRRDTKYCSLACKQARYRANQRR